MKAKETRPSDFIDAAMIAPCGMDCGLCIGFLRDKKPCPGCTGDDAGKPQYCVSCRIKNCAELEKSEQGFCFECAKYPCARLRQLDKRYRTKYGMSMIENLSLIRESGIDAFVVRERARWKCPDCGGLISVHREACIYCGRAKHRVFQEQQRPSASPHKQFVSEAITPVEGSFATSSMSGGEPGLPLRFLWRDAEYEVAKVLDTWKTTGGCRSGSGEQYVRKHWFRVETTDGTEMEILDRQQRSRQGKRWWLATIEEREEA